MVRFGNPRFEIECVMIEFPENSWPKGKLNELCLDPWKKLTKGDDELNWERNEIEKDEKWMILKRCEMKDLKRVTIP